MKVSAFEIPYYEDYLSPTLARELLKDAKEVSEIPRLKHIAPLKGLETPDSLRFLLALYQATKEKLADVLHQRQKDRSFLDERMRACAGFNQRHDLDVHDSDFQTPLGLMDTEGRIVFGPLQAGYARAGGPEVAPIPPYLAGYHVTLFGPPDTAKLAINAMNAYHRALPGEPPIVAQLLEGKDLAPKWGADNEDSKTPLHEDLADAAVNLTGCFEGTLRYDDPRNGKAYTLSDTHRSAPIKRFPGLALPCTFLFYEGSPLPLHLYDFALHLYQNWSRPEALVFYVPKLENEEEAAYIKYLLETAEKLIKAEHPQYQLGTIRLMIVLENPRAILRTHEIMDVLYPYFAGASLGWHDFLGSTARLFKEDPFYRIPVKADPDIVLKYIKASHEMVAEVVGSRKGIKIGGMYGILPLTADLESQSFQVALRGFFKDVLIQLKRNLNGFWVAHPDFVRIGLALVEAWKARLLGQPQSLTQLIKGLLREPYCQQILSFVESPDVESLDKSDPQYVRSLIVANLKGSQIIANHDLEEVRYNVFQSLQYLADWLTGNGCVALPTVIDGVPVRVMDDLATAERSRWEVWHELYHGRVKLSDFIRIAHEELRFIRKDLSNDTKIVQVKWDERTRKWYPIAFRIMLQLMTQQEPPEFATELLMPFTIDKIRWAEDPWGLAIELNPGKYRLEEKVETFHHYFEACGCVRFAEGMASLPATDLVQVKDLIKGFNKDEIIEAASFHGNIGESRQTLDVKAAQEQAEASRSQEELLQELRSLGEQYLHKFGVKFLISAQGKSASYLLERLKERSLRSEAEELEAAREALWEITQKRLKADPSKGLSLDRLREQVEDWRLQYGVTGMSLAIMRDGFCQPFTSGDAIRSQLAMGPDMFLELASLSKTIASVIAVECFQKHGIGLDTSVDKILTEKGSLYRIPSGDKPGWAQEVTLRHLMNHTALSMHYVHGFPLSQTMPKTLDLLLKPQEFGYEPLVLASEPGQTFRYSGGGFLVLEHILELLEGQSIQDIAAKFLQELGITELSFRQSSIAGNLYATGYQHDGAQVGEGRLMFPACAAGAMGTARGMLQFLEVLGRAYRSIEGFGPISHDTARYVLQGADLGSRAFMGADMGLGVFVAEAGDNKLILHQGANDGFRALYLACVEGPDQGKGFVILVNADNQGVPFISQVAKELLRGMSFEGICFNRWPETIEMKNVRQEEIVNVGYKALIFDAFEPTLPEEIQRSGALDPLNSWNMVVGATILQVSNQRFARAENLLSPYVPSFDPNLFGKQGKIMDSWETARHNPKGKDILDIQLKTPGKIAFVKLSTQYHDGNQAEYVRLLGCSSGDGVWQEFLPKTAMGGHSELKIKLLKETPTFEKIRVEIYPDGGLSRLGLYSDLSKDLSGEFQLQGQAQCRRVPVEIPKSKKPLTIPFDSSMIHKSIRKMPRKDLASLASGARVTRVTNEHYGPGAQVISPFPPLHMFDGLESARSRAQGHFEEVEIELGSVSELESIVLDYKFFVNNNPLSIEIFGKTNGDWISIAGPCGVKAFAGNSQRILIHDKRAISHIRVRTYPDGGINRIHVFARN